MVRALPLLVAISLASGCAGHKLANDNYLAVQAMQQAASTEQTPEELIRQAAERISASDKDLRFYSPVHMERAQEKLTEARKLSQKATPTPEERTEAVAAALLAQQLVDEAEKNRALVKEQLALSLEHRDVLLELGSDTAVPKAFQKVMADLDDLIRSIEAGHLDKVTEGQPDLLEDMAVVEADTLRATYLSRARALLEDAADKDAPELAPASFEAALNAINTTDAFIGKNYRERDMVRAKARDALVKASQAVHVAEEVERIIDKKPELLEQYILEVQSHFNLVNSQIGVPELAASSFIDQARLLADAAASVETPAAAPQLPVEALATTEEHSDHNGDQQPGQQAGSSSEESTEVLSVADMEENAMAVIAEATAEGAVETLAEPDAELATGSMAAQGAEGQPATDTLVTDATDAVTSVDPEAVADIEPRVPTQEVNAEEMSAIEIDSDAIAETETGPETDQADIPDASGSAVLAEVDADVVAEINSDDALTDSAPQTAVTD